jgi:hypothetical protein
MEFQYLDGGNSEVQDMQAEAFLYASSGTVGIAATGVIDGLVVTQALTANGTVLIGAGACINQASLGQGGSRLINPSQKTLDIFTANPVGGLPRNDVVVFDSITKLIMVIVGTPNATPTDPTIPATSVALGRLRHAASATTIPTAKIDTLIMATTLRGAFTGTMTGTNVPAFATGVTAFVFGGGNALAHTITFPTGRFTAAPVVTATLYAGSRVGAVGISTAPTASSVGLTVLTVDASALTGTVYAHWIAIQE